MPGRPPKTVYCCQQCGHRSAKWLGKCPSCNQWNSFVEEEERPAEIPGRPQFRFSEHPVPLDAIPSEDRDRLSLGMAEMDRVLGGGLVAGSVVLVGGDPGIGKSTLLLQVLERVARQGKRVLYCTGEESARQTRLRATRIGAGAPGLLVLVEIALETVLHHLEEIRPEVAVIDSIQTMFTAALTSAPGSVGQVRETAERLILFAKKTDIPLFLIGHVTKDGAIAGPKVLEHMVDTVLYFEGEGGHAYRIIRSIKNRYGPTNEIGIFEMHDDGLHEVTNPSAFFLAERPEESAGSIVVPSVEGTRPILLEIQALVSPTSFGMPRRTAIGVDPNRVSLLVAVLDRVGGLHMGNHDVFLNVAGGVRVDEPAADLGIVSALASSFLERPVGHGTVVFGEVGLAGEIRGVAQADLRLREAARMGFRRCFLPEGAGREEIPDGRLELIRIRRLTDLWERLF